MLIKKTQCHLRNSHESALKTSDSLLAITIKSESYISFNAEDTEFGAENAKKLEIKVNIG
jgi:hypothetical protein